jgi:hypothetical protein
MASLPSTPFTLTGGCFCNAIRYTLSVPSLSSRPEIPKAAPIKSHPVLGAQNEITEHLPIISLDHCNSCRRIAGAVVECWFICPQSWMEFALLPRSPDDSPERKLPSESATYINPDVFDVLTGDKKLLETTYLSHFSSSENVHRTFCGRCGTHLTFHFPRKSESAYSVWPPIFDIAVGTMDQESLEMEGFGARRQGWHQEGVGWVKRLFRDGEEKFAG